MEQVFEPGALADYLDEPMFAQELPGDEPNISDMIGKPISFAAMEKGYEHCRRLGLDQKLAYECTWSVAVLLSRNRPHDAMKAGLAHMDHSGTYRLLAILLAEAARIAREEGDDHGVR